MVRKIPWNEGIGMKSIRGEGSVKRDGFSIRICERELLRTGREGGNCDGERTGILECDVCSFSIDHGLDSALEAAAANRKSSAASDGNGRGRNRSDSKRNIGEP